MYRYPDQMLEVPADQYEECLGLLREKIGQGKVLGVGTPKEAESILRRVAVTYRQTRNIARVGNIDSLVFDAQTQVVTCTCIFALLFAVDHAQRRCGGRDTQAALNDSLAAALAAGSKSLVTGIVSMQLLRSQAARTDTVLVRQGLQGIYQTANRQDRHRAHRRRLDGQSCARGCGLKPRLQARAEQHADLCGDDGGCNHT